MAYYTHKDIAEVLEILFSAATNLNEKLSADSDFNIDDEDAIYDEAVLHCEIKNIYEKLLKDAVSIKKSYT